MTVEKALERVRFWKSCCEDGLDICKSGCPRSSECQEALAFIEARLAGTGELRAEDKRASESLRSLENSILAYGEDELVVPEGWHREFLDIVLPNLRRRLSEKPAPPATYLRPIVAPPLFGYQLRPEVGAFAALMEKTLREHDDRPGWKDCDAKWLLRRLREEVNELVFALRGGSSSVPKEAADVANFAMMIADVCMAGTLVQGPKPSLPANMRDLAQLDNYGYEKEDIEKTAPPTLPDTSFLNAGIPAKLLGTAPPVVSPERIAELQKRLEVQFRRGPYTVRDYQTKEVLGLRDVDYADLFEILRSIGGGAQVTDEERRGMAERVRAWAAGVEVLSGLAKKIEPLAQGKPGGFCEKDVDFLRRIEALILAPAKQEVVHCEAGDEITVEVQQPAKTVNREQIHEWAMGFDEDIEDNERRLSKIFENLGIGEKS